MFYRRDSRKAVISRNACAASRGRPRFLVICLFATAAVFPSLLPAQTLAPPPGVKVVH